MHPALSVILFTTLSGSGFGLLAWFGWYAAWRPLPAAAALPLSSFALILVSVGLVSSLWHLGQPQRAWRAFSQWRTSWLSREGVASVFTYLPAIALTWLVAQGEFNWITRVLGLLLFASSVISVICTAMIYASLPPIAAWRDGAVVPGYLGYALLGGLLWLIGILAFGGWAWPMGVEGYAVFVLAPLLIALKFGYWRRIDRAPLPSAAAALGQPALGTVRSFERPHTEANYLLREMGFVLARKHGQRLREIALWSLVLPMVLLELAGAIPRAPWIAALLAALLFQLGALVERWLFFAQARHTVGVYYGLEDAPHRQI